MRTSADRGEHTYGGLRLRQILLISLSFECVIAPANDLALFLTVTVTVTVSLNKLRRGSGFAGANTYLWRSDAVTSNHRVRDFSKWRLNASSVSALT